MTGRMPTLETEAALFAAGATLLAACDEVGRGALAGPVTVGIVVIDAQVTDAPDGVRDSKLLDAARRRDLGPLIREWAVDCAVGHASADEVDRHGVIAALRFAGWRALSALDTFPDTVLLDGSHDWLTPPPQSDLFATLAVPEPMVGDRSRRPRVVTKVKADLDCASVAAASVLAKVERDGVMDDLACNHPHYGWGRNKGYGTAEHREAIARHGTTQWHRRTWRLGG